MSYLSCQLADWSPHYYAQVAKHVNEWACRLQVQMKLKLFDPRDPISEIVFYTCPKLGCGINGVHEGTAIWLVPCFSKKTAAAAFAILLFLRAK